MYRDTSLSLSRSVLRSPPMTTEHSEYFSYHDQASCNTSSIMHMRSAVPTAWRELDTDVLRAAIQSSSICCPERWKECASIDDLVQPYDVEITAILDRLIPAGTVTRRQRPSDSWFDEDCRAAKRRVRALERTYRRIDPNDSAAAAWKFERRSYHLLL